MKISQHSFEPGARAIIQMGEELIGHPTTAINELVKNGYDADATKVSVYLNYSKDNDKSFLVITDNGLGMSSKILFGDWLQPSVSKKRGINTKSKVLERNFLGSKGIGRLAAMALGQFLTVITKSSENPEYSWLLIDREDFKNEVLLSSVKFPGGSSLNLPDILMSEEIKKKKHGKHNDSVDEYLGSIDNLSFTEGTIIIVEFLDNSVRTIIEDEFINGGILLENMHLSNQIGKLLF